MRIDTLGLESKKYYWHHYNFPPFSVGEAGFMRGPKRRDIGHGALAERALVPVVPSIEDFPYSVRVVSDIFESNGSSSMASVCGSSLSLMQAGVPIKAPVAGIAMGLIKEGDDYTVLTDIAGVEDHLGDMDFKVAGTEDGITALQMDIKITGVTFDILRDALTQAREARMNILGQMADVIAAPSAELSPHAPRISKIKIDQSQIGLLIGKGGETIRGLSEEYESQIDVNDDGQVLIYATSGIQGDALVDRIRSMTKEVAVGDEFRARSSRRPPSGPSSSSPRARTACCTSRTSSRAASGWTPSRRCSTRATTSPCAWSRSTASAGGSACASPTTPTWPERPPRSSRPWARAAAAVAVAAAATAAVRAATAEADAIATAGREAAASVAAGPAGRPRPRSRLAPCPSIA
jgi:polyribonucleotide nucleotidyltransferase